MYAVGFVTFIYIKLDVIRKWSSIIALDVGGVLGPRNARAVY